MAYGAVNFNQFCQFDENKCRIFGRVVMEHSIKNSISLMGLGADLEFGSFFIKSLATNETYPLSNGAG